MENGIHTAIAVVGTGAILPDAPNVMAFWNNVKEGRYSITEVRPERWDPALYYDPDPSTPDKAYSKIGGWVREFEWDPVKWHLPVPPKVAESMDVGQKWAVACTRQALEDYGYPKRAVDLERTAVILGNAMAGERHYLTSFRLYFPEYAKELEAAASFAGLPEGIRRSISNELHARMTRRLPEVTEDTMPGELSNCIAGRIANLFNTRGPSFVVDAACASAMAAITAASEALVENQCDLAITGGIDRNMGAPTFIKFCKIGALSATGTRPYAEGADGFVMGEGAAIFLLKRLADAERDGDKVYAVLRGIAGSSDGKGKGITAPNPIGQKLCTERAWKNAGLSPATATMIEGHGTSTRVGDVVEVQSLTEVLNGCQLPSHSVALGSVKSNFGHLKGAAGAAGILKTVLALRDKVLPPSVHGERPNPDIDFAHSPLFVNTELRDWKLSNGTPRRAGVSAFGFGGTNFHAVFEEYIPGMLERENGKRAVAVDLRSDTAAQYVASAQIVAKAPLHGACVIGASSTQEVIARLIPVQKEAAQGHAPLPASPKRSDLEAQERIAIAYADAAELATKASVALKALNANQPAMWKALRAQGIFRGHGPSPKVAFLYTGQGSQYINMARELRKSEPIVADTFTEADRVMTPILGKPLSDFIFIDETDAVAMEKAESDLRQTAITQPAVLTVDIAMTRLLAAYGIEPDMTMGHSLGEYGALVASGALPFAEALEAVAARGREMTRVSVDDKGAMAAVFAPLWEIERILKSLHGYVVIANINSSSQAVIGGTTKAVEEAVSVFLSAGFNAVPLPVSHAFHTSIVAPASEPLRQMLRRLSIQSPHIPIVGNVNGEFYPTGPGVVPRIIDILSRQIAAPVQFVKGLQTLYAAGVRVFVEVGPKKALQGFADDVLGSDPEVLSLFCNHPKFPDPVAFNQALCGLYASGLGRTSAGTTQAIADSTVSSNGGVTHRQPESGECGFRGNQPDFSPIVITGAALGLPGTERIFDDGNIARILEGEQFIDVIPTRFRQAILDKHITRLVKSDNGGPTFESIDSVSEVVKLAGRGRGFDLEKEFGVPAERIPAFDRDTQLAIAVGIDALRDAGIPLIMRYKPTGKGTQLPDRWGLPDCMRDDTGVIFASVFPGYDSFADEMARYYADRERRSQLALLEDLRERLAANNGNSVVAQEVQRRIDGLKSSLAQAPYGLDRRFLLRALSMGHSQFAEFIGARGPNTQLNAACASTTQALGIAEDWIHLGRCRRVIIVSADDITSDHLVDWFGAGFLASGAAATDEIVEQAATPFDRRRHGMIMGMGAAAIVVESWEAARERGIQPICEILGTITANSAFHPTRLSIDHIKQVMERVVKQAETRGGVERSQIAAQLMFMSHETYTPARGGSASAEIHALRNVFGDNADNIVIANTKGFTGHAMGAGIEDVVAIKALETGCVPPVANFKEVDPELGTLNLSKGGIYPVEYALRLGAGFGSQISMALLRWAKSNDGARPAVNAIGYQYRIVDHEAWTKWMVGIAGNPEPQLEVVNRTLRFHDSRISRQAVVPTTSTIPEPASVAVTTSVVMPPPVDFDAKVEAAAPPVIARVESQPEPVSAKVKQRILALMVEKTGYPEDMLDLDLDLEADLGVDTVKQAEMFAAIRELYGIERDPNLKLRDFPTLAHVIQFVLDRRPDLAIVSADSTAAVRDVAAAAILTSSPQSQAQMSDSVSKRILALMVEKTGYPEDMLDLDLDLEADLGVDTVKQAEMFAAIRELYGIERDPNLKLRDFPTLKHVIEFVYSRRPDLAGATALTQTTATPAPQAVIQAISKGEPLNANPALAGDEIKETILAIVAAKTGYPKDMLHLDLDLEADLGIDTVKQAEMFAEVRTAYNIPRDPNLKLRDFPTLAHVIQFARNGNGLVTRTAAVAGPTSAEVAVPESLRPSLATFDAANRVPRRIPVPTLRPPLDMCKSTGVTLASGTRIVLMPDTKGVAAALESELRTRGVEILELDRFGDRENLENQLRAWLSVGPIHGVYWLPALDDEGSLEAMQPAAWHDSLLVRVKALFSTMRCLYEQISTHRTFLVCGTRFGGNHGYDDAGATAPAGGAVTGFAKAFKRERPEVTVKAVDFPSDATPAEIAQSLIDETLRDPGAVEIGYKSGLRWTITLKDEPTSAERDGMVLDRNSVFLVTGAAGSIVSAITTDLAASSGGTFYLLDLVPEPMPDDPDLKRLATDKDALKRELFARIQARGERATPALVERELAGLERAQAALSTIEAVRNSGGIAHYFSVNLLSYDSVAAVVDDIRKTHGRIDVLLHAAGIERSHTLPDKTTAEFDLVFDVKADGWFNLLNAIGDMPLGATVAFSSIAGRFGNLGQTDYSSANDLLCKMTSNLRRTRPSTRGIAIDWTAWGGIGMAARGSIPKMMELAGIDMLQPEAGIPVIRRELTMTRTAGEIVIADRLGVLMNEFEELGGIDPIAARQPQGPMIGRVVKAGIYGGLRIETALDPKVQPFLYDHQIEGVPVLPGVMGIEAFAEAALYFAPGWHVEAIEDVNFLAPFKFYRNEPRPIIIEVHSYPENGELVAQCSLIGMRTVAAQKEPQVTTHFTARVRLAQKPHEVQRMSLTAPNDAPVHAEDIYGIYFHGPAYRVLERASLATDCVIGKMAANLPANHVPMQPATRVSPRLIELCFQTAGLWEIVEQERLRLPLHVDRLWISPAAREGGDVCARVVRASASTAFDAHVADAEGNCFVKMEGYRTVQLPGSVDARRLRPEVAVSA